MEIRTPAKFSAKRLYPPNDILHFAAFVAKVESQLRSLLDYELAVFAEVLEVGAAELLPSFNSVKPDLQDLIEGKRE